MNIASASAPKLFTYFRSSASYRVRIALNLKQLPYEAVPVHLLRGGGEHLQDAFRLLNPHALVPVYEDHGLVLRQSLAIIEYLEERHPQFPLLPPDPETRAQVRAIALDVACEIHPLANLRVQQYLVKQLGVDDAAKSAWVRHWIEQGLSAIEESLQRLPTHGSFLFGDTPGLAECCLIPQLFNARRAGITLQSFPILAALEETCLALPAFQAASPAHQADAE